MNVWELQTTHKIRGYQSKAVDDVAKLFDFAPRTTSHWWGLCPIWTQIMETKEDGEVVHVFMGHRSPIAADINYLATRILVDTNRFNSASALIGGHDILSFCVRGKVLFYCISETKTALVDYPWKLFCSHWPHFFRLGPDLPYALLERKEPNLDPLVAWIRLDKGDKDSLKYICDMLRISHGRADAKDAACGALMALILRRMDRARWDEIDLAKIMGRGVL